tara:strand:+ start:846 stop:1154 length:309 start_codon:yes stop_codon:yes gene_type:complete
MEIKIKIKKNKVYRIKTKSKYFKEKYGVESPEIYLLERDYEVFGDKWRNRQYVPVVLAFMLRQVSDDIFNLTEPVYFGKIKIGNMELGELVFKSELETMKCQ